MLLRSSGSRISLGRGGRGSYPESTMRNLKWFNGNSIMHLHSLNWLLFRVPQRARKTSGVTFGMGAGGGKNYEIKTAVSSSWPISLEAGVCPFCRNFAKLCDAPGFWENVLNSIACLYIEIAYSKFTFCGAYTVSFLVGHTISVKREHRTSHGGVWPYFYYVFKAR